MQSQVERLTNPKILEVQGLSCRINHKLIIDDISFSLPAGSFCCLLGKSGCGKTTLFRSLAGLNEVYQGKIHLNGVKVADEGISYVSSHQRKIGLVFQDYTLFPHLSVRENLLFGAPKCSYIKQQKIIDYLLELVDLTGYEERSPHELSGGQQQRIALARTLASDPLLVLLDEPFSNLEQEQRWRLAGQVKAILQKQSVSALLVTHDQTEAFAFADYIGIMMEGKLVQWGTPEEIYYHPVNEQVAEFIGSGQWYDCQLLEDEIGTQQLATPFGIVNLSEHNTLLTDQAKQLLQYSDNLQLFLRQENIYLPIDQNAYKQAPLTVSAHQVPLSFPIIQKWRVVDKYFSGFLTFMKLVAVLEEKDNLYSAFKQTEVSTFIRSNRSINIGDYVQVELELGSLILRVKQGS